MESPGGGYHPSFSADKKGIVKVVPQSTKRPRSRWLRLAERFRCLANATGLKKSVQHRQQIKIDISYITIGNTHYAQYNI